jgi:peptidoglycan hydrolase-like protein with peptidoglycan-binding domain
VATSAESGRRSSGGGSRAVSVPTPTVTTLTNNTVSNLTVLVSTPFTRRLVKSVSGNDVKNLQIVLNSDKDTKIALEGSGSPGNETNFFGSLTLKAVQKFQVKYSIAKDGDEGYGQVGPKTRAKLNELSGKR